MGGLIIAVFTGIMGILLCILAIRTFIQWQGWWRWSMAVPVLLMLGVTLNIIVATWLDPTSHNLWPLELIGWFVMAGVLIAILYLLRWISNRMVAGQR